MRLRRTSEGQSLVEMALMLPFLIFLLFAIIDMGWYIYGYATIYNSARRGAEEASQLPPFQDVIDNNDTTDQCLGAIQKAVQNGLSPFYHEAVYMGHGLSVRYPATARKVGDPIEVTVDTVIQPLTPLFTFGRLFGFGSVGPDGTPEIQVVMTSRRTVEGLGANPEFLNGSTCQQYTP